MKKIIYILIAVVLLASFHSCKKDSLEPKLTQNKDIETAINNLEDLQAVLYGVYDRLTSTFYYGRNFIIYGEVRSDNAFANGNSGRFNTASAMEMGTTDAYPRDTWEAMYEAIASANLVIGVDPASLEGDAAAINHVIGQAYAIRALVHFDLLKLFGQQHVTEGTLGIPYIQVYKKDIDEFEGDDLSPARNTIAEVRGFIEADLNTALSLMTPSLNDGSKQFMTTHGANALRTRVGVYFEDWNTVVTAAEAVINSNEYEIASPSAFVSSWYTDGAINSIFELAYSGTDNNNINGLSQIYRGTSYGDIQALEDILTIFDAGDVRVSPAMIDYEGSRLRNMGKYPSADYSDNISLIRYEEVILNYAEALFELGNSNALTILNQIPAQRNAPLYTSIDKPNIMKERRRELCFEGFRFDDLARTGSDIPLVSPLEQTHGGPTYGSYNYAFPIPVVETNANSNMVQNDDY